VDQNDIFNDKSRGHIKHKKTLVRHDRARLDSNHPQYFYAQHTTQQGIPVQPSATGNDPNIQLQLQQLQADIPLQNISHSEFGEHLENEEAAVTTGENSLNTVHYRDSPLDNDRAESAPKKEPDVTVYDPALDQIGHPDANNNANGTKKNNGNKRYLFSSRKKNPKLLQRAGPPPSVWRFYCYVVTFWAPSFLLSWCGMRTKDRQVAWREKIGLITVILYVAAFVAYLTFGFTATVCSNNTVRMQINHVNSGYLIVHGQVYDLTTSTHPAAYGVPADSNILYPPVNAGGMDASFLFQNVNGHCLNVLTPKSNSSIPNQGQNLAYYMPCRTFSQDGSTKPNNTLVFYEGWACHTDEKARRAFWDMKAVGEIFFTWDDIEKASTSDLARKLIVFNGNVIDLALIDWILTDSINVPQRMYEIRDDTSLYGRDVSVILSSSLDRPIAKCLTDIAKVGYIDSDEIGCIASTVVLYVSLVFIVGIVAIKFLFAVYFRWVVSKNQGADYLDRKDTNRRENEIEDWSDNMYAQGPVKNAAPTSLHWVSQQARYRSTNKVPFLPRVYSRNNSTVGPQTFVSQLNVPGSTTKLLHPVNSHNIAERPREWMINSESSDAAAETVPKDNCQPRDVDMPTDISSLNYTVPQPPITYQPFGFPLAHTICLVTAYSESVEGLRSTLDSLATTDYPNSHKMILVICDGIIKGSGNDMTTPDIVLSMMKDFSEPMETVQAYSYVSVVSGARRHNMAKVYAGFYKYDNDTMDPAKQQRVPMITVVKCGTPDEATTPKPGNRGKRDSQIILMSFLQHVMFNERMTELEYQIFDGIWQITGIAPDFYEIVLMVDADTRVYPDSVTHMVACMVKDPEVMGLCGETKIANKRQSWVSMIQVFEYFISHHQSKAFESIFGGVTCLPGCFCMYRIKAPKGAEGFWVPILANPDIVERYAENVVDTLHKKNLLLLGEDRFLSTIMLKTFPKRKQIFVPKAVCKTIVPDKFSVLLSQRRRWINSTVHNLMELVLVRDLCGVFCISMQFVVFIELVGTLVLPAAISFTLYVVVISFVKKPTPVLSLVLLALILGLPGLLIVVTASRWSYILWMLIYLISLPIWNFVLPLNAYWKFDDFSWGDTRTISGGNKRDNHDETMGEFDSSQIVMKRWRDYERQQVFYDQMGLRSARPTHGHQAMRWNSDGVRSLQSIAAGRSSTALSYEGK
jgi:chitin synthase